jgi:dTDP-4-dehydrorhamnose 3,5-epimerase
LNGCIYDVVIDLRASSKTCGKWYGLVLSDINKYSFFIPAGFAHGFLTLSDEAVITYKCSDYYNVSAECGVRWDDPKIGIDWKLDMYGISPKLSMKDLGWKLL